jgi:hypothetical protein
MSRVTRGGATSARARLAPGGRSSAPTSVPGTASSTTRARPNLTRRHAGGRSGGRSLAESQGQDRRRYGRERELAPTSVIMRERELAPASVIRERELTPACASWASR